MLVLAADTSLPLLSVALVQDDSVIGSIALEGKGSRNEKLLPAIDWLLSESNVDRSSIDLFAVTRGPGSFTGVRIGLATMQGLALALVRPVCAMSTHEAIAAVEAFSGRNLVVVDDAGRGEYYVSRFDDRREVLPPRLASAYEVEAISAGADTVVKTSEFLRRGNVAAGCARR
ncbi:MAG: tRNA (adenosine(37)-N6)-threonylcarbamoyltransferase complex dimerization subunit type 1 TsaB, partial [Thermoanaerobaculia bacterium]